MKAGNKKLDRYDARVKAYDIMIKTCSGRPYAGCGDRQPMRMEQGGYKRPGSRNQHKLGTR